MIMRDGPLVYDFEWHINNWPSLESNAWIQVDPEIDENNFRFSRLISNNDFDNQTINIVENIYPKEEIIATFMWWTHLDMFEITGLFVEPEYQSRGIGYFLASAARNWLIYTYKKMVVAPEPSSRSSYVEKIIKRGAIEWQDDTLIFLEESDQKYYSYSEWLKVYNN